MAYDTVIMAWLMLTLLTLYPAKFIHKTIYYLLMMIPVLGVILAQFGWTGTYLVIFGLAIWMILVAWPKPENLIMLS
jgi:hypothetical protein